MQKRFFRPAFLSICLLLAQPFALAAQSVEKVKSDVLAALSTPLPITIIGPLLTRDVAVTEEQGGFRAVLADATLMGLFPMGDVSLRLEPLDDETYRITELGFARALDFPGIGKLTFAGMTLDGTWSTRSRSYSALKWVTEGLEFRPGEGGQGVLSMGSLGFDVLKEPDETNTESRFEIAARDVSAQGLGPQNVTLGRVTARLAANGREPVDLYSVLREVLMLGTVRDGGAQLQTLGRSLLGNTYDTVSLDLSAGDLSTVDVRRPGESYFKAAAVQVHAGLRDVAPRNWGGAEITVRLDDLDQKQFIPDSNVRVEEAVIRLGGGNLPVADMLNAAMTLAEPPRNRPVPVSPLLDGLAGFGALELSTEGRAIWVEAFERRYRDGETRIEKAFDMGFDSWAANLGLTGFDRNEGRVLYSTDVQGGRFVPGAGIPRDALPHIRAWFPQELRMETRVSELNDGLLKRLFADVEIRDLREPVELILPLALYAAATVPEVATGENAYRTELFRLWQAGQYRFYPTEVLNLAPYQGEMQLNMTGMPNLLSYLDETMQEVRPGSDEATAIGVVKSGLVVLRNLANAGPDGALVWNVARPDVTRREIELNGITLRYPDIMEFMPMMISAFVIGL